MHDPDLYQCHDCNKQFYPNGPHLSSDGISELSAFACEYCESENTLPVAPIS